MGPYLETTESAAAPVLVLSEEPALVPTTIRGLAAPPDGVTATKFSECNLGSPLREICSTGSARGDGHKRSTSRPVPTHHGISHEWPVKFLEHRIADRRVVRLIQKWLNAGVLEEGKRIRVEEGTPQGGSASPLLANVYLHHVFDLWVQAWRRKRAHGDVIGVRFADDIVLGFQVKSDADQFRGELAERMRKFNLELHPEKTRLLEFGPYAIDNRKRRGEGKPETFNFLGFTHICVKKRSNGMYTVLRQTIRKRLQAKLNEVKAELQRRMHEPIPELGKWLQAVVRGHIRYYGVPMNRHALWIFRFQVGRLWHRALSRRSQNGRVLWDRMRRLIHRWLPLPTVCHPYPLRRMGVVT